MNDKFIEPKKGTICLIQQDEDGRIVQLGLTQKQSDSLQLFCVGLSNDNPFIKLPTKYDLVLKSENIDNINKQLFDEYNKEYIISCINKSKDNIVIISLKELYEMSDFYKQHIVSSLESIALTLDGHQPILESKFDIKVFEEWCRESNLIYLINEIDRNVHIKRI